MTPFTFDKHQVIQTL